MSCDGDYALKPAGYRQAGSGVSDVGTMTSASSFVFHANRELHPLLRV